MRVLITALTLSPSIGGLETATRLFADGLAERGPAVTVATATPGSANSLHYPVARRPGWNESPRLAQCADVIWQNHLSLRLVWPAIALNRPYPTRWPAAR